MNTLFLASHLFCLGRGGEILDQYKIVRNMKNNLKKQENFVFVASEPDNYEKTDVLSDLCIESFDKTLPFKKYSVLDNRTKDHAKEMLEEADLIFLSSGNVPTQNKFFEEIGLKDILEDLDCLIVGLSGGAMNMSEIVYSPPNREGESINPTYKRFLIGLGLTKVSILPNFLERSDRCIGGKNILNEIILPDSKNYPLFALSDGAYIMQKENKITVHGYSFLIDDGDYQLLLDDGEANITNLVNAFYDIKEFKPRIK